MIFRDTNTLFKVDESVGSVSTIVQSGDALEMCGHVQPSLVQQHRFKIILLMDGSDRLIAGVELSSDGNWLARIEPGNLANDNSSLILQAFAASDLSSFIFPLHVEDRASEAYKKFVQTFLPPDSADVPSLRADLRELVIKATKVPYVARSIFQSIQTGNNYQTLDLGRMQRRGGRPSRENFLFQLDLRGKTVLDIGANTGENSRIARKLGASLVDGYEYDPYFVEIGRAINAVSGMTRVSLFQGDCTKPELFAGMKYDVVLALAVWVYMQKTMQRIAEITDTMIFETHTLDHGMDFYYSSVLPHFPHAIALGLTENPKDPHKGRKFVVFGKHLDKLQQLVKREFLYVRPYFDNTFIKAHNRLDKKAILELAEGFLGKHGNLSIVPPARDYRFGSQIYFEIFLAGLSQYLKSNMRVDPQNIYVDFLKKGITDGQIDPGLTEIAQNESWISRKIANKYEDALNIINGNVDFVPPVEIIANPSGTLKFTTTRGETIACEIFDGHHRFFMCELAGVERIHYKLIL